MYCQVRFENLLGMAFCHYACAYERLNYRLDEMLYGKSVDLEMKEKLYLEIISRC